MGAWHPECALNTCCLKAAVLGAFKITSGFMDVSGLDMAGTIEWYASSGVALPKLPRGRHEIPVIDRQYLADVRITDFGDMFLIFPENARKRSIIRHIVGKPVTWFHKDSATGNIRTTTGRADALSPTAIVPSYTDPEEWIKTGKPSLDVWMYQLPVEIPRDIRRIITAEGFIHELGHGLTGPAFYTDNNLRMPDGRTMSGKAYLELFAEAAEGLPPISHYASFYRKNGKFADQDGDYRVAVSEELCESIAAYFLGFAYTGDSRGTEPFRDRPAVRALVKDFLHASQIKTG